MREEITPDVNRSKALKKMANELLERVSRIPIADFPSPNLSDYYDVMHMLIDSILVAKGIKFKGEGAHFELIEEAKSQKFISDGEAEFIQQVRSMRNKYKYEGYAVSEDFVKRNHEKTLRMIDKLKDH